MQGLNGLMSSRNGVMSLVVLAFAGWMVAVASGLNYLGKLDSDDYGIVCGVVAGIITTMGSIYTWTRARGDR